MRKVNVELTEEEIDDYAQASIAAACTYPKPQDQERFKKRFERMLNIKQHLDAPQCHHE